MFDPASFARYLKEVAEELERNELSRVEPFDGIQPGDTEKLKRFHRPSMRLSEAPASK